MKKHAILYGLIMLFGFICFFFVMKTAGLYTKIELRVFNFLIHGTVVFLAIRAYRKRNTSGFDYLKTFSIGFFTSLIGVISFALFQFFYLQFIEPGFMETIRQQAILGNLLSPFNASIFLTMEGIGVSLFTSYIGMRFFTALENVPPVS